MSTTKYSVLLMRDDSHVKRFRMSPFWIKTGVWFIVILFAVASAGTFFGVKYLRAYQVVKAEKKKLEHRLIEAQVRLESLENVEKLLESNDVSDLETLLGSLGHEDTPPPEPEQMDLKNVFDHVDTHQAGVENLQGKFVNHSFRVRFELNNMQPMNSLSGNVDFGLVTKNGNYLPVKTKRQELAFSIQRFKQIITTFALPNGVTRDELFGLRITITAPDGKPIFRETYPLYQLLS